MNDSASVVTRLANLVGLRGRGGVDLDWDELERRFGLRVPDDYKELVGVFPPGRFRNSLGFYVPKVRDTEIDIVGDFGFLLESLRESHNDSSSGIPFEVFPQKGGVIPWGWTASGVTLCWLPGGGQPAEWSTIAIGPSHEHWEEIPKTASQIIVEFVRGELHSNLITVDSGSRMEYILDEFDDSSPILQWPVPSPIIDVMRRGLGPRDESASLLEMLEGRTDPNCEPQDWIGASQEYGFEFPRDYVTIIDSCVSPSIVGVTLIRPRSEVGQYDIRSYSQELISTGEARRLNAERITGEQFARGSFYPEAGGLIPWGYGEERTVFFWNPILDDPNQWYVVVRSFDLISFKHFPEDSMSSFLAKMIQ